MQEKTMATWIDFSISSAYEARYPHVAFGLTLISDCRPLSDSAGFDQYKRNLLRKMRKRETLADISERVDIYDRFFQGFGFECPLPGHLKRTINSGFPRYNLMIDTHFMAEMCAGILVAVTDLDRIEGRLMLDIAGKEEECAGMGGRRFVLKEGEIVLRDEKGVICVLCQGADEKTKVRDDTRNVLFYSFAVPGVDGTYLKEGLTVAAHTMAHFGGGNIKGPDVFVR